MAMSKEEFLDDFMFNFNNKYPKRYKEGMKKYGSHIVDDYTIEQHIDNLEEELFDGLAYLHAIRVMMEQYSE